MRTNLHNYSTNSKFHDYETRGRGTRRYETTPSYIGSKLFNKLPLKLRGLSLSLFKIKIKKFLIRKCYYSVEEFLTDECIDIL